MRSVEFLNLNSKPYLIVNGYNTILCMVLNTFTPSLPAIANQIIDLDCVWRLKSFGQMELKHDTQHNTTLTVAVWHIKIFNVISRQLVASSYGQCSCRILMSTVCLRWNIDVDFFSGLCLSLLFLFTFKTFWCIDCRDVHR